MSRPEAEQRYGVDCPIAAQQLNGQSIYACDNIQCNPGEPRKKVNRHVRKKRRRERKSILHQPFFQKVTPDTHYNNRGRIEPISTQKDARDSISQIKDGILQIKDNQIQKLMNEREWLQEELGQTLALNRIREMEINEQIKKYITYKIKCPICKTENELDYHFSKRKLFGAKTEPCCICTEEQSSVYFKECGHIVCCAKCVVQQLKLSGANI